MTATQLTALGALGVIGLLASTASAAGVPPGSLQNLWPGTEYTAFDYWAAAPQNGLVVVVVALSIAVSGGVVTGAFASVGAKLADPLLSRSLELFAALPAVVVVAVLESGWGQPPLSSIAVFIGAMKSLEIANIIRTQARLLSETDFITSARAMGLSRRRIFRRHILPHVLPTALRPLAFTPAAVVGLDAAWHFLGLSSGRLPSWGAMLQSSDPTLALVGAGTALSCSVAFWALARVSDRRLNPVPLAH